MTEVQPFLGFPIDEAVALGAAVELQFIREESRAVWQLLEGPPDLLKAILRRTPASWTMSEERVVIIAGQERPAWVLSNYGARWVIFEIEGTLIVLRYNGPAATAEVLSALASLERLNPLREAEASIPPLDPSASPLPLTTGGGD